MTQVVLSIPNNEMGFLSTLANKMGWKFRTQEELINRFMTSCPKDVPLTDDEIQSEVNAVRYGR